MVNRIRAFRISRQNEKRGRSKYCNAYTKNNSSSTFRFAKPSRFRTKIACIKNNVLLFFLFLAWPMFHFPNRRYVLRTRDSFLFLHLYRKYSGCMSVARESIFFLLWFFFILSFVKVSPDKWITRMACFAKSLVRAKAKSDDLSLSPKATSIFFCLFFTLTLSLFLSRSLILAHFFFLSFSHACAN